MNLRTLTLSGYPLVASWNLTLHRLLIDSGMFAVRFDDRPPDFGSLDSSRCKNLSLFMIDGRRYLLDTWDTDGPSDQLWHSGWFRKFRPGDITLLKIQYRPAMVWKQMHRDGYKVSPWTMFKSREFAPGCFRWSPSGSYEHLCAVTGANRFGRGEYAASPLVYSDMGKSLPFDGYIDVLRRCRWGLSLRGKRNTDGKNRREVEFSSCGMPLALNYDPHYPFPFRPGIEYFRLSSAADLSILEKTDPAPFAAASERVYRDHFSPEGAAHTLFSIK